MTKVLTTNAEIKKFPKKELVNSYTKFWLLLIGFMILIFARNILTIKFPVIVLLGYFCVIAVFSNETEIMALAVSCIPFSSAFQYRYALFALIVIYLIKYPRSIKFLNAYIPLALMMLWELLHGLLPYDFSFVNYLQCFAELIFLSFVMSLGGKKYDFTLIARTLAICVAFASCIDVIKLLDNTGYNFAAVFEEGYRLGINDHSETSYVMNYNPNALGGLCNISICGLLCANRIKKINALDMIMIALLVFFGFLTLSRSFILCLLLVVGSFLIVSMKSLGNLMKTSIIIIGSVLLIVSLVNYVAPYVFDNFLARFNEDDISNGRNELFAEYTEFFFASISNLLFGIGLQGALKKVQTQGYQHINNVPHNGFQEIVVDWGLIGIILFVVLLLIMVNFAFKINRRCKFINWIPLILILSMAMSGQLITSGFKLLALVFAYMAMCNELEKTADKGNFDYEKDIL